MSKKQLVDGVDPIVRLREAVTYVREIDTRTREGRLDVFVIADLLNDIADGRHYEP